MIFIYDPKKSEANFVKHGVDFEQARVLWEDDDLLHIPARSDEEVRYLVVGQMYGKCWTAIVTDRGDAVRIISVRRSHKKEEVAYEWQKNHC